MSLKWDEWPAVRTGRTLPPGKTRYTLYRWLGGPQGRCGQAENLAPPVFDPRNVQLVAPSLYRLSYPAHTVFKPFLNVCNVPSGDGQKWVKRVVKIIFFFLFQVSRPRCSEHLMKCM